MMERFRLRVRREPRRGHVWELHLFPAYPHRQLRAAAPEPIAAAQFGPTAAPRWLQPKDGMRLALAFSAARWLVTPRQRRLFRAGLEELPSEVVLYWFTLCFYGYRQAAGRAALRTLFTHEEPEDKSADHPPANRKRKRQPASASPVLSLFHGEPRTSVHDALVTSMQAT